MKQINFSLIVIDSKQSPLLKLYIFYHISDKLPGFYLKKQKILGRKFFKKIKLFCLKSSERFFLKVINATKNFLSQYKRINIKFKNQSTQINKPLLR